MFDLVGEIKRILVAEWESKGKVGHRILWVGEHVGELESELLVAIEVRGSLGHNSPPFSLVGRLNLENRLESLVVKFGLPQID